jgi:hypothetical protein
MLLVRLLKSDLAGIGSQNRLGSDREAKPADRTVGFPCSYDIPIGFSTVSPIAIGISEFYIEGVQFW